MSALDEIAKQQWVPTSPTTFAIAGDGGPGPRAVAMQQQTSAAQKQRAEMKRRQDVFTRLMGRAIPGASAPGNGIVPYANLPRQVTDIDVGGPMVGFDPSQLKPDERLMLAHLLKLGEQERMAQQQQQQTEPAPMAEGSMR